MKKSLLICCFLCIFILCAACARPQTPPVNVEETVEEPLFEFPIKDGHYILDYEQLGLSFAIPIKQMEDYTIFYGQYFLPKGSEDAQPIDGMQIFYLPPGLLETATNILRDSPEEQTLEEVMEMLNTRSRLLYSILYYNSSQWDNWMSNGKTMADITGNAKNSELGRQNDLIYVYTEPAPSEEGLSEEELPFYRQAVDAVPAMRAYASMIKQAPAVVTAKYTLPAFSSQDIYGTAVDSSIFANYDLTMLNIWGTFCNPCIQEMPDLGKLAAAMPAGTQLIGLVGDALDEDTVQLAQTIVEETQADFPHIVPDKELYDFLYRDISLYPTTLFIDSQGNTVGEPIFGTMSKEKYEEELSKRLIIPLQ